MRVPAGGLSEGQERNDSVTATLTEWTQVLPILYIVTGLLMQPLRILTLECLKVSVRENNSKIKRPLFDNLSNFHELYMYHAITEMTELVRSIKQ